jgi:hypothetical protein
MDALLKSFVNKVHVHVTTTDASCEGGECIAKHLIPVLSSTATYEVKSQALGTLSHLKQDPLTADLIRNGGGIIGTLHFMLNNPSEKVSVQCIMHAYDIISLADADLLYRSLCDDILLSQSLSVMTTLLEWFQHIPPGHPHNFCSFLSLCAGNYDLIKELKRHNPIQTINDYFYKWEEAICSDSQDILFVIKTAIDIVGSSKSVFRRFWKGCGPLLIEAYCKHRTRVDLSEASTPVMDILYILTAHIPPDTQILLAPTSGVYDSLCDDLMYVETHLAKVNSVLMNHSMAEQLLEHARFISTFFFKALEYFSLMDLPGREATLDYLTIAASNTHANISREIYDAFYTRVLDNPTRAKRALLYSIGVQTKDIVPQFKNLLADNQDPDFSDLDSILCDHFDVIISNPRYVLGDEGVVVDGGPSHTLFHCIENVIGKIPLGNTLTGVRIHNFLRDTMLDIQSNGYYTYGMQTYFNHIKDTFNIQDVCIQCDNPLHEHSDVVVKGVLDCISTCPITLEAMHCPVIASDGNTYEMQAILRHLYQPQALSPLTRELLSPHITFNRALEHKEEQLWKVAEAVAIRVRRRDRYRNQRTTPREEKSEC